ncbi:co-chaperone YbbN [Mycobacteroides abscessus]|nr:tetratricopeptide repeat protein [Mycobacteroides abscessus]AMU65132.1 co-chaperone YbbN [Mycobacteroides abscessus]ANO13691.1 co-chaperone YbbN [Mycobacteroides abscessus]ARQ63944.1 co-chaperone YbbN [Mycobacteroides abscessus subsp. massiliense]MBL3749132.1 tetratricopeptide repeat protein [Mycobacteroides abscessus subsp. massiliense]MBN7425208.1 tetratricopeptide repeat protein [Mycobacteroides abscessus subsp. massiliense]
MTRPRPAVAAAAAMSGAVDLSALKQRAQEPASGEPSAGGEWTVEVTEANLESEVLTQSNRVPVIVLLGSPRSEASAALAATLGDLVAEDRGKWALARGNVDTNPQIAQVFGVQAVPTVVAVAAGRPLTSFTGPQPADQLRRWLDSILDAVAGKLPDAPVSDDEDTEEAVDPALAAARDALDSGDFEAARTAYQGLLDGGATGAVAAEATASVRQITFLIRATGQPQDAVLAANAAPGDIDAGLAAADVEVLSQQPDSAFDRLVALVRGTSDDDRAKVRARLLELFELFDPADPAVIAGRRKLANALF